MAESEDGAFRKEIETWALGVSQEARAAFASQCAARVLPNIGGIERPKDYTGFSFDVTLLRAMLTSAVAGKRPTDDVKNAAASSAVSTSSAAYSAARSASFASSTPSSRSATAASSAASSAASTSSAASSAASAAYTALSFASSAVYTAARSATKLLDRAEPSSLFETSLWMDETIPDAVADNWTTLRGEWAGDPAMAFWIDWYEGLLKGRTPDWELWHDIVLIKEEHWEAGPDAVAEQIKGIQDRLKEERLETFEDHARSMIPRASVLSKEAERLSKLIEEALLELQKDLGNPNQLPESIEPLRSVPQILKQISGALTCANTDEMKVKDLARLSQALINEVLELNGRLSEAQKLADALGSKPSFWQSSVMSGFVPTALTGVIAVAATLYVGQAGDDAVHSLLECTENGIPIEQAPYHSPKTLPRDADNDPDSIEAEHIPEHKRRKV